LPERTVRITVDGDVATVHSRIHNSEALVGRAGVELGPGDRIEERGDDDLLVDRATEALFEVDGRAYSLRTQAATIDELLQETGVALNPGDSVLRDHDLVSPSASIAIPAQPLVAIAGGTDFVSGTDLAPVTIEVRRAVPFSVIENGQDLELRSSRETVATALRDVGLRLGPGDLIQPPPDTELTAGLQVRVQHASEVVVTLPEGKSILYTLDTTVGEAMAHSGVPLPADYRLDPPEGTLVSAGMAVHVIAVSEEQAIETERIESETVYEPDVSLPYGAHSVVQGQDGVHYRRYSVVSEDGQVVSRDLVEEWDDPAAANTLIYYSTADAPPPPAPDGSNVAGVLRVYATWYSPASSGRPPSDPSYGLTATGVPVTQGIVAVDPSVIPLGTRLFIPGYGNAIAADTGGGIRGDMIDLGYPDGVVPDWISQWVDIYILE
jgi:uncharacterized protein YabE (DUF348 family)/3D (Asp-Asp-Asp) domain-containing protein